MKPLISVIIPVYNEARTLERCLRSVCAQSYSNLEIICVNDGSTDNSGEILNKYAAQDSRMKIITQPNKGQAAARNAGLEQATGEWVTGVDGDDFLDYDAYECCLPVLGDKCVSIVCYGARVIGGDPVRENYLKLPCSGTQSISFSLLAKTNVCFWNKLFRREILDTCKISFPEGCWFEDDAFFFIYSAYASHIAYVPEIKYNYIVNSGKSVMDKAAAGDSHVRDRLRVLEYIFNFFNAKPLPENMEPLRMHIAAAHYSSQLRMQKAFFPDAMDTTWKHYRKLVRKYGLFDIPHLSKQAVDVYNRMAFAYYCPPDIFLAFDRVFLYHTQS